MKVYQIHFNDTDNKLYLSAEQMKEHPWEEGLESIERIVVCEMRRADFEDLPEFDG